jgi:pimeloyl-ACP methyl ester carboxylesterase
MTRFLVGLLVLLAAPPVLGGLTQAVLDATFRGRVPPPGDVVEVDGVDVHVRCEGEGPLVLLVHGFAGCSENMALLRRRLAGDHRACALDRPGYAWSGSRPMPPDVRDDARVVDGLLDALGAEAPVVVVAHSYGAWVTRAP